MPINFNVTFPRVPEPQCVWIQVTTNTYLQRVGIILPIVYIGDTSCCSLPLVIVLDVDRTDFCFRYMQVVQTDIDAGQVAPEVLMSARDAHGANTSGNATVTVALKQFHGLFLGKSRSCRQFPRQ